MSKFTSFQNPRYSNAANTAIDLDVTVEHMGNAVLPYTIHQGKTDDAELWTACQLGAFGTIGIYVEPAYVPAPRDFPTEYDKKQVWLKSSLRSRIAKILGTTSDNLNDYEAKLLRLSLVAERMRTEPSKFYNSTFNGILLGTVDAPIVATANTFIDQRLLDSTLIDLVTEQFHQRVVALGLAATVADLDAIDWPV